ncbi:MAG: Gfo/Idh/MocA family oxidoreductase, partial [Planctomycetaceae bacterium]
MTQTDRRVFLRETVSAGAVGAASIGLASVAAADAASGRATVRPVTVGLAGCGGRGLYLAGVFGSQPNVSLRWVCDPDSSRLVKARVIPGHQPHMTGDLREMLRDDSLDAVIIATPDHWHAPAAILACDAGRHVYVEKPCSHTIREGRLLVEAARRNKRIVQHGTQVRSTDMMIDAVRKLREGIIGNVKVAKAWNIQRRGNIGRQQPGPAP